MKSTFILLGVLILLAFTVKLLDGNKYYEDVEAGKRIKKVK